MVFGRSRLRRRWPVALAMLISAWAGIYAATFKATVTDEAGSVYAFMRYDHRVRWKDATDIYLEQRRGANWYIVVTDAGRHAHIFEVAELSIEERDRVMGTWSIACRAARSSARRSYSGATRRTPCGPWGYSSTADLGSTVWR